jgi:hypothetical protein
LPLEQWLAMLQRVSRKEPDWKNPRRRTSVQEIEDLKLVSLAVGSISGIMTVNDFIQKIVRESEELVESYEFLRTG